MSSSKQKHVVLRIIDSGVGINDNEKIKINQKINEKFSNQMDDNEYMSSKGTGLGMFIVKSICNRLNYDFIIEKTIEGTSIAIHLLNKPYKDVDLERQEKCSIIESMIQKYLFQIEVEELTKHKRSRSFNCQKCLFKFDNMYETGNLVKRNDMKRNSYEYSQLKAVNIEKNENKLKLRRRKKILKTTIDKISNNQKSRINSNTSILFNPQMKKSLIMNKPQWISIVNEDEYEYEGNSNDEYSIDNNKIEENDKFSQTSNSNKSILLEKSISFSKINEERSFKSSKKEIFLDETENEGSDANSISTSRTKKNKTIEINSLIKARNELFFKKSYKIVIVDDNIGILKATSSIVKRVLNKNFWKFDILEGKDGLDTLKYIMDDYEGLIRIVMTDEDMEFMNGSESAKLVSRYVRDKKIKNDIKFVSITCFTDETTSMNIQSAGIKYIIHKPSNESIITDIMNKLLNDMKEY